jgi:acyl-CoA dehydrogenase
MSNTENPAHSQFAGVNFALDNETELILKSLDDFIEREVEPIKEKLGETWSNPRLRHQKDGKFVPDVQTALTEIRKRSAEAGFYAMNLPEEAGGGGISNVAWYRAVKHVARHGPGLTEFVLAGPEGPKPLLLQAEGQQVEEYLEPTIQAEKSTAFAQTEPGAGSDSPNMETSAEKVEDGWIINGIKQWITNGPYADFVQVFARTTPQEESGRYGGITCFLVESDEYEVGSINNAVGREGHQSELIFDDVFVPDDRVLGDVDTAFYAAMDFLSLGRLEICGQAVGYAESLLERGVDYATERTAFGQQIDEFQQISSKLASGRAKLWAADSTSLRCAWKMDSGEDAIEASSIAKWFTTNTLWELADDAVQVHGGNGLSEENGLMDHLLLARVLRIVEGTDEIQLNTIAGQLGLT